MKNKTSSGLDELSSKMLKYYKRKLVEPLIPIINLSPNQGVYLSELKSSKVTIRKLYKKYKKVRSYIRKEVAMS